MHYYQFNIGDYKSHTEHLSEMEDLAYRRLLDWYYLHEAPIPCDIKEISRQVRMRSHTECIASVLEEFFHPSDLGWTHKRADKEIAKTENKSSKARESARIRWEKANADAMRTHSEGNATHNTLPITQDTKPIKDKQRGSRLAQDFELTEDWVKFCRQERPELFPHKVFSSFKDYWVAQPGQKGVKLDWFATWRNWVRNVKQERPTFAQQVADVARTTVETTNKGPDPELVRIEQDRKKATPPSLETLERMAQIRRSAGR